VACVSRLIGKSDSTVKRSGWQVTFCGKVPLFELKESPLCSWMPANTLKATPNGVAFNVYYAGHWPPRQLVAGGLSTVPLQTFPTGSSLLRAASLAVALVGRLLFLGWPDFFPAAYSSLALI
jgi:hypothetical protein